eukprot:m.19158 g.19158  ORF g.19158 m.19158 type:complete len:244 (+) comp7525_c0_seq1:206-937(+)
MPGATLEAAASLLEKNTSASSSFQTPQESPSMSPAPIHQNRRMRLKPVRGPESITDERFGQGIVFSFNWDPRRFGDVILRQFPLSPAIDHETTKATANAASQLAAGHESDSDCEMEMLDFTMEDEMSEAPVVQTPKPVEVKRKSAKHARHEAPKAQAASASSKTKPKSCVCCGCTSTPLWRDIGKNRPLCNACGIRWKKYGVICESCQYVPCKQERENKTCRRCLAVLPASKRVRAGSPTNSS